MHTAESLNPALHTRLIDGLYVEALVMADEARAYFDREGAVDKDRYDVMTRLSFTCESLKVTTRIMHVIAWLMTQKAWLRGEITAQALADPKYRLAPAVETDRDALALMPEAARLLVVGSQSLYDRVLRLQERMAEPDSREARPVQGGASPALELIGRLERSL